MSEKKAKKSRSDDFTWANVRKPLRQITYELVHGFSVSLIFLTSLVALGPFYAILTSGLAHAAIGSVLSLGVGVFGNPIVSLAVAVIRLIDGDLEPQVSKFGFFIKALIRAVASAGGSALAGLMLRGLYGGLLSNSIMPGNVLPGTMFATGFGVFLVFLFENHVTVLSSIQTDDGYGMILSVGLSQFVFGLASWIIWQVTPNLNILFAVAVAVLEWNAVCWYVLLISVGAAAGTVGLYYLFLNDIFSTESKNRQKAENLSDDVTTLIDNKSGPDNGW